MEQERIWNLIAKKLSGESTQEELQELEVFLRSNPDLHYSMQTIIDLWNSEFEPDHAAAHQAFNRHIERMYNLNIDFGSKTDSHFDNYSFASPDSNKKNNNRRIILAGISVLILVIVVFLSTGKLHNANDKEYSRPNSGTNAISEISTKNGSKTTLTLPDGTLVKLNAGSKISYNDKEYGNSVREINLTGEAFFDVVKNPEKPFIIHTSKINIRVLGTAFNVKSYPGEKNTETSLIRGSIEVTFKDRPSEKYILKPNEKLIVANDEAPKISAINKEDKKPVIQEPIVALRHLTYEPKDSTIVETSWVENKLIFQDQDFRDLAIQMERWYGVNIHFNDEQLEEMRFTGIFQNETIQQALEALKLSNRFNYTISGDQINILK